VKDAVDQMRLAGQVGFLQGGQISGVDSDHAGGDMIGVGLSPPA
jgi:hypothetical protein